jgi:CreA protein
MKKSLLYLLLFSIFLSGISYAKVEGTLIGDVTAINRIGPRDDVIKVIRIDDPENPFVSIYITQVKNGEWGKLSDPSNSSIACRMTGDIPIDKNGKEIINKKFNAAIGKFSKSIGTKQMKIARWYDKQKHVLVYVVYTTKWLGGSLKHNLSVVPLGKPLSP